MSKNLIIFSLFSSLFFSYSNQSEAKSISENLKPLFDSDELLELEIKSDFPYRSYKGTGNKPDDHPELFPTYDGKIVLKGSTSEVLVKIQARGNSKLYLCDFSPVVLEFDKKNDNGIFNDQGNKIKLATHCDEGSSIAQNTNPVLDGEKANEYVIKEYLAYKIHEMMIPESSLKVRLAKIKYVTMSDQLITEKFAFFLEHKKHFFQSNPTYQEIPNQSVFYQIALGKNAPDRDPDSQQSPTVADNTKMLENINLNNYIRFLLFDRIVIPSDRSYGLLSGNVLGMLDSNKKYLRLDFDFDRSLFVGKFEIQAYYSHDDPSKNLVDNFTDQMNKLCLLDSSPKSSNYDSNADFYLPLDVKKNVCKEVLFQIKESQLDKKIIDLIRNFEYLNDGQKNGILNRTVTFFDVISQLKID